MKRNILIALLCFCSNIIVAHTCENEKAKCPLDGTKVTFCVTMSMTTFGTLKDFQKQGAIGDHYEQFVNACPKCHFSGYIEQFKKDWNEEEKSTIMSVLEKYTQAKMNEGMECKIAAEIQEALKAINSEIAYYYQLGSYVLRGDNKHPELRKELQKKAAQFLILAIDNNEFEDKAAVANIQYLIGEMDRRTGNFDEAIKYYDLAISNPDKKDWVEAVAKEQKEMALRKDDNNDI